MSLQDHLISAIESVENAFPKNELGYLALTQKVEHVFRDKLAFVLHQRLQQAEPTHVVCREWLRSDLAILRNGLPLLIVEAKAGYTFDITRGNKGYDFRTRVRDDIRKAEALAAKHSSSGSEIYALVIATHPHEVPDELFKDAIKYYPSVRRHLEETSDLVGLRQAMDTRMEEFEAVHFYAIKGGHAFGVEVSVYIWLYRAKKM